MEISHKTIIQIDRYNAEEMDVNERIEFEKLMEKYPELKEAVKGERKTLEYLKQRAEKKRLKEMFSKIISGNEFQEPVLVPWYKKRSLQLASAASFLLAIGAIIGFQIKKVNSTSWKVQGDSIEIENLNPDNEKFPLFVDIDRDSDLDIIIAEENGTLALFKNEGDGENSKWILDKGGLAEYLNTEESVGDEGADDFNSINYSHTVPVLKVENAKAIPIEIRTNVLPKSIYFFEGESLKVFVDESLDFSTTRIMLLSYQKKLYLKSGDRYYLINRVETKSDLIEETNTEILNELLKISKD